MLNRLWRLVNDPLNYLTPSIKPIDYASTLDGRRRRVYDKPATPLDRLLAAEVLAPGQQAELIAYRDSLSPAAIAREIADLQAVLLKLAKAKTEQLYLAHFPTALAEGGEIGMPLARQSWGDIYGIVKDKYGIEWMVNCSTA